MILEAINDDEGITSKALGMAMMGGMLTYEMIDGKVCGKLHEAEVLDFNECIIFGKMMQDHTKEEILAALSDKYSEAEIKEAMDEVEQLRENEELFTEDVYENHIIDFKKRPTVVKALCLHIAHDCNLACKYCFAEEGEYHGRRALMSYETGKQALDFLIANSGNRRNLEVDFFGGEPLLNFDVVKQLVAYGREQEKLHDKHFRFTLTTNGVLLNDDIMEFANKEMDNVFTCFIRISPFSTLGVNPSIHVIIAQHN
mgnify:CR=1 FL=1